MNYTLKSVFLLTAWVGWCLFAILSDRLWAYDATEIAGWVILSSTVALPFVSSSDSRRFWSVYAATTATFLLLTATNNETLVRFTNAFALKLVDLYVALVGNTEGSGSAYLKTNILGIMVRLHCGPLFGVLSAFVCRALFAGSQNETAA